MRKRGLAILVILQVAVLGAMSEAGYARTANCQVWNAEVDPSFLGKATVHSAPLSDEEVLLAMDCLLRNQGNRGNAVISGVTRLSVSQILPRATVDLASLYYVSYLFTGNYQHGDGIALWNRKGGINPPGGVETAYASYRAWFKKVKSVGLAEARKQHLDPLEGTGLYWYGR
jgi:hypothetical protein